MAMEEYYTLINTYNKTRVMAILSHRIHLPFNIFSTDRGQRLRVTYATKTNYDFKKHSIEYSVLM